MLVRPRTSCRKRLVFVHAASETPDTNVQAVAEELQRVKSKVDQQSILLQELLRNKEPVEPAAAETVQKPAQEVGVLETDYFDMKVRKPAGPYEKETPVSERGRDSLHASKVLAQRQHPQFAHGKGEKRSR